MTKEEYLRRLHAEMASAEKLWIAGACRCSLTIPDFHLRFHREMRPAKRLCVVGPCTSSHFVPEFGLRGFTANGDVAAQNTFLDALAEAGRQAGVPVYGLLPHDHDPAQDGDEIVGFWRASDRELLGVASINDPIFIIDDLSPGTRPWSTTPAWDPNETADPQWRLVSRRLPPL